MSKEIEKSSTEVKTTPGRRIISNGMMAGMQVSLGQVELPRMFNQLIIFLLDGSGSMTFEGISGKSKGDEVHEAVIKVLQRLQVSKNKSSFDVAFWAYANETVQMYPLKPVKEIKLAQDCFDPCKFINDYKFTKLTKALGCAKDLASEYLEKYKSENTKILILILGDGAINDYSKCLEIKEEISNIQSISFSSILFESTNWQELEELTIKKWKYNFSQLASSQADYLSTVDPEKIRSHMIQSITKVSKI